MHILTSLGQECDIERLLCLLHFTIETSWCTVRVIMPYIVLPGGSDAAFVEENTLREHTGMDVMAQLKASLLNARRRQDVVGVELTDRSAGEPNHGNVLRAAMTVAAFVLGGDAPCDVNLEVTLTLRSQRPMIFQDSVPKLHDHLGVLEMGSDNSVDRDTTPGCANIL